jgi:hypoxanthine phosphoribosyltransferase
MTAFGNQILYTEGQIVARIDEMAGQIISRYDARSTIFVSLLNGAVPFTFQLMRSIQQYNPDFHSNVQYMKVSRYGFDREPGELKIISDLPPQHRDLTGYNIVLLDDLIDGGGTLSFTKKHLLNYGATSVDCVVLVKKLKQPPVKTDIAMYGFEAPDEWLTGMGMDDSATAPEANRWAPWIGIAK